MNIINKLTIRHLKNNRSRTILTIVGIAVSVAMITAIFTGLYSYFDYHGRLAIYTRGDYHFQVTAPIDKLHEVLDNDKRVESYGIEYSVDSMQSGYRLKNAKFKYNSVGSWVTADKQYFNQMITCDYDGRFPENSSEILVEEKYITDNNLDWKIGDTVSIESGYRYIGSDFVKFPKHGQYSVDELFDYGSTDSYKIVGILHNNLRTKNSGTMLMRGADKEQNGAPYALVKLKHVTPFTIAEINSIVDKFGFTEKDKIFSFSTNSEYLQTKLALDKYASVMWSILPMCAAIILLIIAASMVLIYNSFGMSLNEKIKYLGMLASIGATRKQKKKSVIYEALILSAIGIPIGILTGLAVISATFALIGERIKTSAMNGELGSSAAINIDVRVSAIILVIIVLIGIATVLISAMIPSKRASLVTPIDAIRQNEEIKIKKKIRTPFIIKKIFGYEGTLAFKNMRRNGAKSRIIVTSIALSLVLFLGCNYFCNMFAVSTGIDNVVPYQIEVSLGMNNLEGLKEFAVSNPEIKKIYSIGSDSIREDEPADDDDDGNIENGMTILFDDFFNPDNFTKEYKELSTDDRIITFYQIDDEIFNELCKKNGIDYKQFYDYEYGERDYDEDYGYRTKKPMRVLLVNSYNHTDENAGKPFNESIIGTTVGYVQDPEDEEYLRDMYRDFFSENFEYVEDFERTPELMEQARLFAEMWSYEEKYEIHGLADYDKDNYIFNLIGANSIAAFYPLSVYANMYPSEEYDDNGPAVRIGIETDTHAHTTEILNEYIESNEIDANVFDDTEWRDSARARILVIEVLIYGFIILISIITITNIINTITNSVNHRKKEFAMLKSVGITPGGFRKMLSLESLFYALEGVLSGLPLSVLACFAINKLMKTLTVPFHMDIRMCVISVLVVFIIIGLTMLYSSLKIKSSAIIDELKQEIN